MRIVPKSVPVCQILFHAREAATNHGSPSIMTTRRGWETKLKTVGADALGVLAFIARFLYDRSNLPLVQRGGQALEHRVKTAGGISLAGLVFLPTLGH